MAFNNQSKINELFELAKTTDEFEYVCTLLRLRGMEEPGWDPLKETISLTDQLLQMIEAPIVNTLKTRLILFMYCHFTEMNDLYNIIGNLVRIAVHKDRYSILLFPDLKYPSQKISKINEWLSGSTFEIIGTLLSDILVREVRNAFYHSEYILTDDSINLMNGQQVDVNGIRTASVPLDWLESKINLAINLCRYVISHTIEEMRSYKADKIIKGRFAANGSWMDIQLLTDEKYGLIGFKSPATMQND
jgi:hypothetical protein